jgi:hypothetical protein
LLRARKLKLQIGAMGTLPYFGIAVKIFDADCDAATE